MAGNSRRIIRIVAIVGVAAAAGYFMQADEPAARAVAAAPVPPPDPAREDAPRVAAAPPDAVPGRGGASVVATVADIVPASSTGDAGAPPAEAAVPPGPAVPPAAVRQAAVFGLAETIVVPPAPDGSPEAPDAGPIAAPEPPPCVEALDVVAAPGAMLTAVLTAPCRPFERVVIRHAGLAVTAQTTPAGTLTASIPAFDPMGAVTVQFADGRRAEGAALVADLAGIARFAVQWMAGDAFHLHAFAEGAAFGSAGHVHAGAPGTRGGAAGYVLALGDASLPHALLAEVYTFPADRGAIALELEAPILDATCGREMLGETLQWSDGALTRRDLSVEMPDCGEGDGFLLLQNPMADLTLAAN